MILRDNETYKRAMILKYNETPPKYDIKRTKSLIYAMILKLMQMPLKIYSNW